MTAIAWTKHCKTEEEKQKYLLSLQKVKWVLEDLKTVVNSDALEASEISPRSYDSPNWAYRQAHVNGYKQAIRDFHKLLTLDPQE